MSSAESSQLANKWRNLLILVSALFYDDVTLLSAVMQFCAGVILVAEICEYESQNPPSLEIFTRN